MIKVVIDNNIIIDLYRKDTLHEQNAKLIFDYIKNTEIIPYVCSNSLTDIYYVLRKMLGYKIAKQIIIKLINVVNIIPLNADDCKLAVMLPMTDFEDAIVAVCAKKIGAELIISRDEKFIKSNTGIKVISPESFLDTKNVNHL